MGDGLYRGGIPAAACVAVTAILLTLPSCKGRRASDMVPTGDTVEVNIQNRDTAAEADSVATINNNDTIRQ